MWISVHDTVDCAKLRKLARMAGCSKGEALGVLSAIWLWGAKNADQSGRIRDSTEEDIALVALPFLTKSIDSNEFVEKMIEAGWIERVDGELYFHDWEDWQAPWYKYQREKDRDTKRRREARKAKREADGSDSAGATNIGQEPASVSPSEPKNFEQTPKKQKSPTKPKPEKKHYGDFVTLTEEEYGRLVEKYGEEAVKRMIEILDNYKGSTGKKYASDYRTILNWVWERVRDENPRLIKAQAPQSKPAGDISEIIPEEWRTGRGG